jgi:NADH:ubiquinone oxidoreductase subunit 6 (subunit J)
MLTSTSAFSRFQPTVGERVVALSLAGILLTTLILVAVETPFARATDTVKGTDSIILMGQSFLGDDVVPFELASVLLLVVMIGAAYLARGKRPAADSTTPEQP